MTTQHKDNRFCNINTNLDGGNRCDQDTCGPFVYTLLEVSDVTDQCAPEPVTKFRTTDLTEKKTTSIEPLSSMFDNLDIDDFQPFDEDSSDDDSDVASTISSEDSVCPNKNRYFLSSGNKLDIGELEEACGWLSSQSVRHQKNDRARLENKNNIFYKKVFLWDQGHEVINYWNNKPVLTAKDYDEFKEKMMLKLSQPVMICEMIKLVQQLEKKKSKVIFWFASPIEAMKFWKNFYHHLSPISPVLASHPSYKTLFEVEIAGQKPRPAKTVQELMNGSKLYFATLQATYDGSALSHDISNDESDPAKRAAVEAYVMNQKIDVFDASLTVMTDDPILPFKEGLIPILQDNLFFSAIHSTSGPHITTTGAPNISPNLRRYADIQPGYRLNSLMINNKHNRAKTISQIVKANRLNASSTDSYRFCKNNRNNCK